VFEELNLNIAFFACLSKEFPTVIVISSLPPEVDILNDSRPSDTDGSVSAELSSPNTTVTLRLEAAAVSTQVLAAIFAPSAEDIRR
tara:strand:+ start:546 stop:803 length:258 start_codon:yes stop_codon:yes gene_type:complete